MITRRRRGAVLADAACACVLLALLVAGAVGATSAAFERWRAPTAARAAAADMRAARSRAVARLRSAGLLFERGPGGAWMVSLVDDGDGDGLRSDDIRRGIDPISLGPELIETRWGVAPGFAASLQRLRSPPPDEQWLPDLSDPVRFGARDLLSCSPRGTATPGTLYLSDGRRRQMAVVVAGASARVRVWEYDLGRERWVLR